MKRREYNVYMEYMEHNERRLLSFLEKYRRPVFFWVSFVAVIVASNMGSVILYDKYFRTVDVVSGLTTEDDENCSLLGINLHGELLTYIPEGNSDEMLANKDVSSSEYIVHSIQAAEEDLKMKAILVEVDSLGGYPVAGEEIALAIHSATKPVVAVIRGGGLSAAYWAVSSADHIFASKNSDIGSIGVTISYLENVESNKKS